MQGSGDEEDKVDAMPSSLHCTVDAAVDADRVVLRDGGGRKEDWCWPGYRKWRWRRKEEEKALFRIRAFLVS
jgi:hypothetical protein